MKPIAMAAPAWLGLVLAVPSAAADWPTAGHDFQRSSYTAAAPAPPYRVRWVWSDGQPWDADKLKALGKGPVRPELLPAFSSARFMNQAQPVARAGVAYLGSVEGDVYAIDLKTGATRWKAKAGGPIVHCLTVSDRAVYAATLRSVDAFALDGKRLWSLHDPHLGGFKACPAVVRGLVLAGSVAGYFYGIDAATGELKWECPAGAAIYHSPAVSIDTVYFGAEDLCVHALDIATGKRKWKSERLAGMTFGQYWPVVAEKAGVVMVRTGSWGGTHAGLEAVNKAPFDYDQAQQALRKHFDDKPYERCFFALNLADGKEKVRVDTGYFGVSADLPPPPVVRGDGTVFNYFYAKEGAIQKSKQWGAYGVPVDFGIIDFQTGLHRRFAPTGTTKPPSITRNDDFHQVSMGGNYLFGLQVELSFGCVPLDGKGPDFSWVMLNHEQNYKALKQQGKVGMLCRHDHGALGPAVLPDVVLVNPAGGTYIVAFESAEGGQ